MKGPRNKKSAPAELAIPGLEMSQLESLLDFMAAHNLEEFEYEHGGFHVRLRKGATNSNAAPRIAGAHEAAPAPQPVALGAALEAPSQTGLPATPMAQPAEDLHLIKSPIVGTFYAAPSPEAPPFVKVGDHIQTGQVVCIIEAMKLMNEIEADVTGEVARLLVENGQPVEYGQSLFAIRAAKKK
jgi:acetyl-CoA carboxylase biotin carboxyl carrier protein